MDSDSWCRAALSSQRLVLGCDTTLLCPTFLLLRLCLLLLIASLPAAATVAANSAGTLVPLLKEAGAM